MTSFVFWNLMGNRDEGRAARMAGLRGHLGGLAASCGVDVLILVESPFTHQEVLDALNGAGAGVYHWPPSRSRRVHVYTRLPAGSIADQYDSSDGRLTIRCLTTAQGAALLLAAVHLPSRLHRTSEAQGHYTVSNVAPSLRDTEDDVGHQRTVLVGDLNMDPYDRGLTSAEGFNAVMTRDLASAGIRTVDDRQHRLFYNPMWGSFGDRTPGPPGGYFYRGDPLDVSWHHFDQVLLRPAVMNALTELRILDAIAGTALVTARGRPRTSDGSDHLPLLFRLDV